MRITHFPTPWDEHSSSQRVRFYTVLSSGLNLNKQSCECVIKKSDSGSFWGFAPLHAFSVKKGRGGKHTYPILRSLSQFAFADSNST